MDSQESQTAQLAPTESSSTVNRDEVSQLTTSDFASIAHWSEYGAGGSYNTSSDVTPTRAVPANYEALQEFIAPKSVTWNKRLTPEQLDGILMGFTPLDMDFKWFVYCSGPFDDPGDEKMAVSEAEKQQKLPHKQKVIVYLFRSWTGFRIAEVTIEIEADVDVGPKQSFESEEQAINIVSLVYETSEERVGGGYTESSIKETVLEVFRWVLQVRIE